MPLGYNTAMSLEQPAPQPSPEFEQGQLPGTNPSELEDADAKKQKAEWEQQYGVKGWSEIWRARLADLNEQAATPVKSEETNHLHLVKDEDPEQTGADPTQQN